MKRRTTLLLDEEVVKKAKKLGINISQFCENALREAIKRLEGMYSTPETENPPKNNPHVSHRWAGQDLNLRSPPCEGGVLARLNDRPVKGILSCVDKTLSHII